MTPYEDPDSVDSGAQDTILVAIDESRNALTAARVGAGLAGLLDARLWLIHVLGLPGMMVWGAVAARMRGNIRAQAEALLSGAARRLQGDSEIAPEWVVAEGVADLEVARAVAADPRTLMVITGRRGLSSEKRVGLRARRTGHLGSRLAVLLPVPVLVVPPDPAFTRLSMRAAAASVGGSAAHAPQWRGNPRESLKSLIDNLAWNT
ncbi:MAG: universal stress protein [Gammaproteobacteria bacterium]|nr:universal stress protein [Gammaproteobacteria bacterium]